MVTTHNSDAPAAIAHQPVSIRLDDFRLSIERAAIFVYGSDDRPSLACVRVTAAGGKLRCKAADGFIAGMTVADAGGGDLDVLLYRKEIERIIRWLPRATSRNVANAVTMNACGDFLRISYPDQDDLAVPTGFRGVGVGSFPRYHHIIPTTVPTKGATSALLDSRYVARVAKAASMSGELSTLRFRFDGSHPEAPVVITVADQSKGIRLVAVIMPMITNIHNPPSLEETVAEVLGSES